MNKISNYLIKTASFMAILTLISCAEPGIVIKNGPAGPNTSDLIKANPDGLIADKENARHGSDPLKPVVN